MISVLATPRITQRDTFHKVQCLATGLYLRIRTSGRITLTDDRRCTWFPSRHVAIETISRLGNGIAEHVEVSRCDA